MKRGRVSLRNALAWLTCLVGLLSAQPLAADLTAPGEALLKIEFLERFTRFVEWPDQALGGGHPLFILCIAGTGPVADTLPQVAGFARFKNRPVAFRRVRAGDDLGSCHLVFLAANEEFNLWAFVAGTAARPILTVADVPRSAARGAVISFYREGDRILFEINRAVADKAGLKVSSRLLKLARLVTSEKF